MAKHNCDKCSFRSRYDRNPASLLGRLWHWHTGWCPGWKKYLTSLTPADREKLIIRYTLKKS